MIVNLSSSQSALCFLILRVFSRTTPSSELSVDDLLVVAGGGFDGGSCESQSPAERKSQESLVSFHGE